MPGFRLLRRAREDVLEIGAFTAERWGARFRGCTATDASTTSRVRVLPSSAPAARAAASSNAMTSQPRSRRLIYACFGERLA